MILTVPLHLIHGAGSVFSKLTGSFHVFTEMTNAASMPAHMLAAANSRLDVASAVQLLALMAQL
jgi:hypothetical protein